MKLSIIICTYNRSQYLPDALESIKNQAIDTNEFELIIINNNSTDSTDEICKTFVKENPSMQIVYAIEHQQGLSYARNKGIELARAPYLSFIDDDAITTTDYAQNIIRNFDQHPEYDALGGKVLPIYPNGIEPDWMSPYQYGLVAKVDRGEEKASFGKKYPVGCNMAFRTAVFKEIGVFNVDLTLRNDDKYIFLQMQKHGKKTLYVPDVVVNHNIDAYRLEYEYLHKLSRIIGSSERIRLKQEPFVHTIIKPLEYFAKLIAGILIALKYWIQGYPAKASFLIEVRWIVLTSFFRKMP